MVSIQVHAYDIAVKNTDGMTIYYNYVNNKTELEVTFQYHIYDEEDHYYDFYSGDVVIPDDISYANKTLKVTRIGNNAFDYCSNLTSVVIGSNVTIIGMQAFQACSGLASITIPSSVISIGSYAFFECSNLSSVIIPNKVTSIGSMAFDGCTKLSSLTIPQSVKTIGSRAFSDCPNLTRILVEENNTIYDSRENSNAIIEKETNKLISGCQNTIIPNSVTCISGTAFWGCKNLSHLFIPSSVTSIDDRFQIGSLFSGCDNLRTIVVDSKNPIYDSRDNCNAIIETESNRLIAGCAVTVVPHSVSTIGKGAFAGIDNLTSLIIPQGVRSVENYAFSDCMNLKSLSLPNSLTSIGYDVIANGGITDIYSYIIHPFALHPSYGSYDDATCYWGEGYNYNMITLHVPLGTKSIYERTEGWTSFHIVEWDTGESSSKQCAKPHIYYNNGQLSFKCETEGVSFISSIKDTDIKDYNTETINLTMTYQVSVYATKSGYEDSEVTQGTLCWIDIDPQKEGIEELEDGVAQVKSTTVFIQTEDGVICVQGAPDGTRISVFGIGGEAQGQGISQNGLVRIITGLKKGDVAVVKIGERAVKVKV